MEQMEETPPKRVMEEDDYYEFANELMKYETETRDGNPKKPSIERCILLKENKVRGKELWVPLPAYVFETGEFVDLNCCLTPWCKNFGKSCIEIPKDGKDISKASKLAEGYSFGMGSDKRTTGVRIRGLQCDSCGYWGKISSNRGASELMSRYIKKYAPALFCVNCSINGLNETETKNEYKWEYAAPVPNKLFEKNENNKQSGSLNVRCHKCRGKRVVSWRERAYGVWSFIKNPKKEMRMMYDAATISLNDFRRSGIYMNPEMPSSDPPRLETSAHTKFYTLVNRYQYIAVEWIGYFNNLLRYGGMAEIKYPTITKEEGTTSGDTNGSGEDDIEDDEIDVANPFPKDITKKKDLEHFQIPQVQTDTLIASSHMMNTSELKHEHRIMLSVLQPSGYILLATLNYTDQYNHSELHAIDKITFLHDVEHDEEREGREFCMHPHLVRKYDPFKSKHKELKGSAHTSDFEERGTSIHSDYHAHAHYYTLEKIVAKIPELMLVQDNEREPLMACAWAFRERILKNECHLITCQNMKDKDKSGKHTPARTKGAKELMQDLTRSIREVKKASWEGHKIYTPPHYLPNINSELFVLVN